MKTHISERAALSKTFYRLFPAGIRGTQALGMGYFPCGADRVRLASIVDRRTRIAQGAQIVETKKGKKFMTGKQIGTALAQAEVCQAGAEAEKKPGIISRLSALLGMVLTPKDSRHKARMEAEKVCKSLVRCGGYGTQRARKAACQVSADWRKNVADYVLLFSGYGIETAFHFPASLSSR